MLGTDVVKNLLQGKPVGHLPVHYSVNKGDAKGILVSSNALCFVASDHTTVLLKVATVWWGIRLADQMGVAS